MSIIIESKIIMYILKTVDLYSISIEAVTVVLIVKMIDFIFHIMHCPCLVNQSAPKKFLQGYSSTLYCCLEFFCDIK